MKIAGRLQAVDRSTTGTAKATEINRVRTTGKVGDNKAVPPESGLAIGAALRFLPGKKTAKFRNILDGNGNRKYQ